MGAIRRDAMELSPRQRQVVEMIAAGRTNPEIAHALGISLQGAKWHVSEVLARLDVSTREEAAEAWRDQRGVPGHVRRLLGALSLGGAFKAVGVASAAAGVGLAAVLGVSMANRHQDQPSAAPAGVLQAPDTQFSETEARERARYLAGEYLVQTDLPQTALIAGRPISMDDLNLVELTFVPGGTTPRTYYSTTSPDDTDTWVATFRRDGLVMPGMGWDDAIVNVTVRFDDGTGHVSSASAGGTRPGLETLPAPVYTPLNLPEHNRVTEFYEVMGFAATGGPTIHVYGTADGDWCWTARQPQGAGVTTCGIAGPDAEHPHIFSVAGTGRGFTFDAEILPARFGAVTTDVASVALGFADGTIVETETVAFPEEVGQPWRAFAVMEPPEAGALVDVVAYDPAGHELSRYVLPTIPRAAVPPYVREPLSPIAFSGAGAARGGDFELPPPGFTVNIRLLVEYAGDVTATIVCDTGSTAVLEGGQRAQFAGEELPGTFLLLMPPEAQECHFEVSGTGTWSFRSP